ncbi:hypothetical protein DL98DRAFT_474721 [Cadophora sp. DSE1049]|nr:hypothetical protein DL98DRAFT_474721 [Cadophora sp. DSE1049]
MDLPKDAESSKSDNESFSLWYTADKRDENGCKIDPARQAFDECFQIFRSELSKDKTKLQWLEDSDFESVQGVLGAVTRERKAYELRIDDSPIRQSLCRLSERLLFYGNIMDVMIQQHPEYVALVWGAMRFLVVGVVNQQKLISRLSSGLCQIAEVLPRAELILRLYPISAVKTLISRMYAQILRFLIRSLRWYQESKFSHLIHAITRPAELRFDDLIEDIRLLSHRMTDYALASGHAEQRDMHAEQKQSSSEQHELHKKVDALTRLVEQLREIIVTDQAINASARIEIRQELSHIQLGQLLSLISNSALLDPIKSLQTALFMRKRRSKRGCEGTTTMTSTIDVLKYLIAQALNLNKTVHTDAAITPWLKSYMGAQTESDWFNVLASIIQGVHLLYIIVDVELLYPSLPVISHGFSWPAAFRSLFAGLVERNVNTILKVALVSYGSPLMSPVDQELRNSTVLVGSSSRPRTGPEKTRRNIPSRRGEQGRTGRGGRSRICFR